MSLELAAMRWLWIDRRCLIVLEQRSPRYGLGVPDVIGVTTSRHLVEIEIERSFADFKADSHKRHREIGARESDRRARQFYYFVPHAIAEKVEEKLPDYAGLMVIKHDWVSLVVRKVAPVNSDSKKLDFKECTRLARLMTSHMMGYAMASETFRERWRKGQDFDFTDWVNAEVGTFTI